ncbi:MAG: helix-hairpin-helix domain-containing protein [Gammaproteobacteria bacterium]|jgi:competence protein ComEA|nr:helix-hairpin-helix domain-containing protein [Gammaproteobacteria bacterium]
MKMKIIKALLVAVMLLSGGLAWAGNVNINTADAATLAEGLNGVGIKKAQAIVDYRKQHGPFKSIQDLAKVKGINDKLIEKNKESITLGQ